MQKRLLAEQETNKKTAARERKRQIRPQAGYSESKERLNMDKYIQARMPLHMDRITICARTTNADQRFGGWSEGEKSPRKAFQRVAQARAQCLSIPLYLLQSVFLHAAHM